MHEARQALDNPPRYRSRSAQPDREPEALAAMCNHTNSGDPISDVTRGLSRGRF